MVAHPSILCFPHLSVTEDAPVAAMTTDVPVAEAADPRAGNDAAHAGVVP